MQGSAEFPAVRADQRGYQMLDLPLPLWRDHPMATRAVSCDRSRGKPLDYGRFSTFYKGGMKR